MQLYETTRGPKFGKLIIANSINNAKGFYQKAYILFLRAGGKLLTGSSGISKKCRYYNITHNRLTYTNWLVWFPHRFSPLVFLVSFFLRSWWIFIFLFFSQNIMLQIFQVLFHALLICFRVTVEDLLFSLLSI